MDRQYYLWTAGGATVSAAIAADFLTRLRHTIATQSDTEIGGLLLGRRDSEDRITIEDFDLLPSEHRRGLTFTLSSADRKELARHLRARHHGLETVGTFRSHLRHGVYMDQYDFDLMSGSFPAPSDVMLLVRPEDWTAGLFVWEQGDIHRQKSYLEFHFDPNALPLFHAAIPDQVVESPSIWNRLPDIVPVALKIAILAAMIVLLSVMALSSRTPRAALNHVSALRTPPLAQGQLNAPVDPDISQPSSHADEMHIRLSPSDRRPSPFTPAPAPTPPIPPVATNSVQRHVSLKPEPPQFISIVSVQPVQPGTFTRGLSHVPILNLLHRSKYKAGEKFSPATPVRQVTPRLPADWQTHNGNPAPLDVKIWVDEDGHVTRAQPLSREPDSEVAELASNAALKWSFEPARLSDRPVASEMIMHFRFAPRQVY